MFQQGSTYIHCGSDKFDITKFEKVKNFIGYSKPIDGGLWASPVNSKYAWKEAPVIKRLQDKKSFSFKISDSAKILKIEKKEDLINLPRTIEDGKGMFNISLDFEKISQEYDMIYCNAIPESELDKLLPKWECECILVMNPQIIIPY